MVQEQRDIRVAWPVPNSGHCVTKKKAPAYVREIKELQQEVERLRGLKNQLLKTLEDRDLNNEVVLSRAREQKAAEEIEALKTQLAQSACRLDATLYALVLMQQMIRSQQSKVAVWRQDAKTGEWKGVDKRDAVALAV